MIWTDMDAIGPDREVIGRRYLTTMYSAYRWFPRAQLFERSLPLADIDPELGARLGGPLVYTGEIFSHMIMGNLVHTSTVLLRRERLERVQRFNEELRHSGEDYDFHLRTCREGPVAYLDVASILYQRGRNDQLTVGAKNKFHMAKNFLATVGPAIERDRDRIHLSQHMIDDVLAEAYAWVGEAHLDRGEPRQALRHLATSLRHQPRQPRVLGFLALSLLPAPAADRIRRAYRRVKGGLRA
jgi:hypothetical protein